MMHRNDGSMPQQVLTTPGSLSLRGLLHYCLVVIPTTVYLALGSSCAGDVARLQSHINEGTTEILEPGSALMLDSLTTIFPFFEVPLLHGLADLMLATYMYYFLVVKANQGRLSLLALACFFLCIFNPLTFELVAHNTRQLFSFSLVMLSMISIDSYFVATRSSAASGSSALLRRARFSVLNLSRLGIAALGLLASFITHTTTPVILVFAALWLLVSIVIYRRGNWLGFARVLNTARVNRLTLLTCGVALFLVPVMFSVLTGIGVERFAIYFVEQSNPDYNILAFDATSVTLVASLIVTVLFLAWLIILRNPAVRVKSLALTLLIWIAFLVALAAGLPLLSEVLRRLYQPIVLLTLPFLLGELLVTPLSKLSKYCLFSFVVCFFVVASGLQYQKLANAQAEGDTFYSLANTMNNSCLLLR